ncbi:Cyanovirin-N [Colletotrichum somersetense]|nr:Cyanovirin-N [Colletotrichum somersetense]
MKILAAIGLTLGLITTLVNAQPRSITATSTATSSKPIEAVTTAASQVLLLPALPETFHTVTTPSIKRYSVGSGFTALQKPVDSLPITFDPHPDSMATINNQDEPLDKRLEGDGAKKQGCEDKNGSKDPEDQKGHLGFPKSAHAAGPSSTLAEHRPEARSLSSKKNAGGFLKTCAANWVIWELNSAIWAQCRGSGERRGKLFWSRIGLDHMLANERGQLVYRWDGGFSSTCVDCKRWGTANLACRCLDGRGDFQATSINLDEYIGNYDGLLCSEYECGAREAPPR